MEERVDCRVFEDQLDALVRDELPEEGVRCLLLHAGGCPECAMQLRVKEHLFGGSLEELEQMVPEGLLESLWDRVKPVLTVGSVESGKEVAGEVATVEAGGRGEGMAGEVAPWGEGWPREQDVSEQDVSAETSFVTNAAPPSGFPPTSERSPFRRWVVPTLAAATVVLLFSTGLLVTAVARGRGREAILAQQVLEQRRWMAELELSPSADPVARTAALAGKSPWARALSRQESISVRGLQAMLRRMPGDRIVLTAEQVEAALRSRIPLNPPFMREALAGFRGQNGVKAVDLLKVLEALDVDPEVTLPTAELLAILS